MPAPSVVIVTCFGRLGFLKVTLPRLLNRFGSHVIVATSSECPDRTSVRVQELSLSSNAAGRVFVSLSDLPTDGSSRVFNKPILVNTALRDALYLLEHDHLTSSHSGRTRTVALLDADTLVLENTWQSLVVGPEEFGFVRATNASRDLTGVLVCDLCALLAVGGMDERMHGWGAEDIDLRLRLYTHGLRPKMFEPDLFVPLAHDDSLRVEHYTEKDKFASLQRNLDLMVQTYHERTGRKLEDDWKTPELIDVLGYAGVLESLGMALK